MTSLQGAGRWPRRHRLAVLLAACSAALALIVSQVAFSQGPQGPAPADPPPKAPAGVIPGQYVVVLEAGASPAAVASDHGLARALTYRRALRGFAAAVPAKKLGKLKADKRVNNVVADRRVGAFAESVPTGVDRIDAEAASGYGTVKVAVLDTGVDLDHPDLNVSPTWKNCSNGKDADDKHGHGSHVAGSVAAVAGNGAGVRGVAAGAEIVAVKVLGNSGMGSLSSVICGIDWVTAQREAHNTGNGGMDIAVANMSLGGGGSDLGNCGDKDGDGDVDDPEHAAICNSAKQGVVYVVAAGNDDADAAGFVPAAYDEVVTVSALADYDGDGGALGSPSCANYGPDDSFATFSNWGADVDVAAPGVCIESTYKSGSYATFSGTSMASPHVAGAVAKLVGDGALTTGPSSDASAARDAAMAALDTKAQTDSACGYAPDSEGDKAGDVAYVGDPADSCGVSTNSAPTADAVSVSVDEDDSTSVTLSGSDAETCELTFAVDQAPAHGSLGAVSDAACTGSGPYADTASVTYTPDPDYEGSDSFTYTVSDGTATSDPATVSVTVNGTPDAPEAADVSVSTDEDTAVTVTLEGSDVDAADCELTFAVVSGPSSGSLGTLSSPSDNCDDTTTPSTDTATVEYAPDANFNGSDSFTYKVTDGGGSASPDAKVSVTVNSVNDVPTAESGLSLTTDEDTSGSVTLRGWDVEDCELTFAVVDAPANGSVALTDQACDSATDPNSDTALAEYTPDAHFNGTDSFSYKVSDGTDDSAVETVDVTVNAVNDKPLAEDVPVSTEQDTQATVTLAGSDVETCELTFAVVDQPTSGTLGTLNDETCVSGSPNADTATVNYTPNTGFDGTDTFTYRVNDGALDSDLATVTVSINTTPTADAKALSLDEDTSGSVTLSGSDPETCELTFAIDQAPANGSAAITGTDQTCNSGSPNTDAVEATYTPDADFEGSDSFTYTVSDGTATSDPATVSVTVNGTPDAPEAEGVLSSTDEDTAVTVTLEGSDVDAADCELTFAVVSGPSSGSLGTLSSPSDNCDGTTTPSTDTATVEYAPAANFNGSDSFTYTVSDGTATSDPATVSVTVNSVNDVPTAESGLSLTTDEDTSGSVTLSGTDVEDCELTFMVVDAPANGSVALTDQACDSATDPNSDTALAEYTPDANFNGSDPFTYKVVDGDGGESATETVDVTVNAVNDKPTATDVTVSTDQGTPVTVTLEGSDVETCELVFTIVDQPTSGTLGTLSDEACDLAASPYTDTATVNYTPNTGFDGTDTFTYTVSDPFLSSDPATVTVNVTAGTLFVEDFEGDVSSWTASGLWHLTDESAGCASTPFPSSTHSAYFGNSKCTYAAKGNKASAGTLTSPEIAGLTDGGTATLSFDYWREVEYYTAGSYDRTWVEVSYDGGSSWTTVWFKDSTEASDATWKAATVSLSPTSTTAQVRFRFDTIDGVANDYTGWLIDDVTVE